MRLLSLVVLTGAIGIVHGQATGPSACASVLNGGIYNTLAVTSTGSTYAQFATTVCSYQSSYTYSQYAADSASLSSGGQWNSINVAASFFGIGGRVGGGGGSTYLSQSEYSQFQQFAAAFQASSCSASTTTSVSATTLSTLQQFISPQASAN